MVGTVLRTAESNFLLVRADLSEAKSTENNYVGFDNYRLYLEFLIYFSSLFEA
jgi:hypothetical protein